MTRLKPFLFIACVFLTKLTLVAGPVDFVRDVKPFLEKKCLGCHNPNIAKGDLVLDTAKKVLGSKHELVVPGKALESDLYLVATPEEPGEKPTMPEEGEALTEAEAELLKNWINQGAKWPEGIVLKEASKADKSWWAYQKLTAPKFDSIDDFVNEKLVEKGLKINPPANRRDLIRRATYDLTGLPPTPEEVAVFVKNDDPQAYEKLINRLLASPRYGERWGRHWLDVVRFGESIGFERNVIINNLWPFRDYVIESINADKPFDQLIREHIAGDVIGENDPAKIIGTAFLVAGPYDDVGNQDAVQKAQIRANTLDEIISATGEAFLGMTLGCARCHDHKFDPILQTDYYQMYATFSGVKHGAQPLATAEEKAAHAAKLKPPTDRKTAFDKEKAAAEKAILARAKAKSADFEKEWTRPKVDRTGTEEKFKTISAKFVRLICTAQDANPASKSFRIDEFEIWSADEKPRNVALASNGGKASGASREVEDFPGAYGAHLVNDGKVGARFISAKKNDLTIELAEPTAINRVVFSSARGEKITTHRRFIFVGDYRIEISTDGKKWIEIANGADRKPANTKHRDHRWRIAETTAEDTAKIRELSRKITTAGAEIAKIPALKTVWIGSRNSPDAAGPHRTFIGGNPQKKGESVVPASLSTLENVIPKFALSADSSEHQRRFELANWITHSENPLSARVLANRLWHYHFGTGIVDTPNDFGYMGGRPTHPELLDFLATELKSNGWKLKAMHRLIMLSDVYRQSSNWRAEAAKIDGDSRFLWRFPPRRLSAEEIRDTILFTSGKLNLEKNSGPGFRLYRYLQDNVATYVPLDEHGPETFRRAVFHQNARASVVDLMTDFDQPDCAFSTPRRSETTTPLQALTMLNHSFTITMADALAARVTGENAVDQIFQIAYQHQPDDDERARSEAAISQYGLRAFCRAILNSSELIYVD